MAKILIVAGQPGSGKTTFCKEFIKIHPDYTYLALDDCKEFLFDTIGFDNLEQKSEIVKLATELYNKYVEYCLSKEQNIIMDYPFSDLQKNFLKHLGNEQHQLTTVVLYGAMETLYERIIQREKDDRHLGHFSTKYHRQDLEAIDYTYETQSFAEYQAKCALRNYQGFSFATTIKIDTTDLNLTDYASKIIELNL